MKMKPIVLALASWAALPATAAEPSTGGEVALDEMVIQTSKPAVPANLPATTEGVTALQILESVNTVTSAETIQYLPSVHVRQRYIGDRNAIVAMRMNSSIASAQTIVYADSLLLSNYLNNSFSTPPRWGMVSPEEISRVDVIYGPFSALYPGNSMGGVVLMTTRMPERFEAHVALDGFSQQFKEYGTDDTFNGWHGYASVGNKVGDWSFWISGDHLDNHGQPQTFGNTTKKSGAPAAVGSFTVVDSSKVYRDIDTSGNPRIIVSSLGADHTVQDTGKLKLAYDFSPTLRASYTLGIWQNDSDVRVDSYLRDALGNTVFNTIPTTVSSPNPLNFVRIDGVDYTVSSAVPSQSSSENWLHGLSLKSNTGGVWDWEVIGSLYDQKQEISRQAAPTSGFDSSQGAVRPGGTITNGDGTGWQTLDLKGDWRPGGDMSSAHQVSMGYHYDHYELVSDTNSTTDWLSGAAGALTTNSRGQTQTNAVYLQDAWAFAPDWKLVAGGRYEYWDAYGGSNFSSANTLPTPKNVVYADRTSSAFSPKLFLSWQASEDWLLRGSFAKAVRFPTVAEMFQLINYGAGTQRTNDPNLKPESVLSGELAAEQALATGMWRTSLFWEDKRDALISQTDLTVSPNVSSIQNVDQVFTAGIETALQVSDLWIAGFDLTGSVTYVKSTIKKDTQNPGLEGTDQPRIPDWRATVVGVYRASEQLSFSMAARYSGRQHNQLFNTTLGRYNDVNPNVYGAVSSYTVVDGKVVYKVDKQWTASLGINNIGNYKYYVNPNPYPQRTVFAGLKYDY